jgi:hypothetical protein
MTLIDGEELDLHRYWCTADRMVHRGFKLVSIFTEVAVPKNGHLQFAGEGVHCYGMYFCVYYYSFQNSSDLQGNTQCRSQTYCPTICFVNSEFQTRHLA